MYMPLSSLYVQHLLIPYTVQRHIISALLSSHHIFCIISSSLMSLTSSPSLFGTSTPSQFFFQKYFQPSSSLITPPCISTFSAMSNIHTILIVIISLLIKNNSSRTSSLYESKILFCRSLHKDTRILLWRENLQEKNNGKT